MRWCHLKSAFDTEDRGVTINAIMACSLIEREDSAGIYTIITLADGRFFTVREPRMSVAHKLSNGFPIGFERAGTPLIESILEEPR